MTLSAKHTKTPQSVLNEYSNRIHHVLHYIRMNLRQPLTLEELAEVASFSPYHFHRIFKCIVGESPGEYTRKMRVEKAASLLMSKPRMSMTEIALECGFSGSSQFAKAFKAVKGVNATLFRSRHVYAETWGDGLPSHPDQAHREAYDVQLVTRGPIVAVGTMIWTSYTEDAEKQTILKQMSDFYYYGLRRIQHRNKPGHLGITAFPPGYSGGADLFQWYAVAEVSEADPVPDGMVSVTYPSHTYAVIVHKGPTATIGETYHYFFESWLPTSGYAISDSYWIHYYDERFLGPNHFESELEIHIPVGMRESRT